MGQYYDGAELLSQRDIDGEIPEIFLCTTNRTGGKTTYFTKHLINKFKKTGEKFTWLYRFKYELDDCADKIFKDVSKLFFKDDILTSKAKASEIYHELFLNGDSCGYAITLNAADQIKKMSHLFSDTARMFMDEFMSETNHYCNNEVKKFISVHQSLARGNGEQAKYLPVYMCANPITLLNPYYQELGITTRLNAKTHFLRGRGFVLEQGFVESAYDAQQTSGFNKAFCNNQYLNYGKQGVYMNDNSAFVEKPMGRPHYLATIRYENRDYAIKEYAENGIIYCDDKPDFTFPNRISVTASDHSINYVMLKRNDLFLSNMRFFFEQGCFRFKDLACKQAVLGALSY